MSSTTSSDQPLPLVSLQLRLSRDHILLFTAVMIVLAQLVLNLPPLAGARQDFCVYYTGVQLAWEHTSPYDLKRVTPQVINRLNRSDFDGFAAGFFLPPSAFVTLGPWATLSWPVARMMWLATLLLSAIACGCLAWTFGRADQRASGWGAVIALTLLNPLGQRSISLGQTGLYFCACVALGQWAFERRRPWLGSMLWGLTGVKPHLALPVLAVAWFIGGWRRLVGLILVMAAMWLSGAVLLGNPFSVTLSYFEFLRTAHQELGFNTASYDQVVSWNRLLLAIGGKEVNISAPGAIVGFAIALIVLWAVRVRGRARPSESWVLASCISWGLFTVQAHGYELVLLTLAVPYLLRLLDSRRYADLGFLIATLVLASIPKSLVLNLVNSIAITDLEPFIRSYRAVALAGFAFHLLVREPPP